MITVIRSPKGSRPWIVVDNLSPARWRFRSRAEARDFIQGFRTVQSNASLTIWRELIGGAWERDR